MHALARRHYRLGGAPAISAVGRAMYFPESIDPNTCGVDDAAGLDAVDLTGEGVFTNQASNFAAHIKQIGSTAIVHQQSATCRRCARQRQRQTCIVELGIPIFDAALETL